MTSSQADSRPTTPTEQLHEIVDAVENENATYHLRHALQYLVAAEESD